MNKNLVSYPNTKNFYLTKEDGIVKIMNANFEVDKDRYSFKEDSVRFRCTVKKAKRLYKEIIGDYDNEFLQLKARKAHSFRCGMNSVNF